MAFSFSGFLVAQGPISHFWTRITEKTFAGMYHANAFDLALMIPYFIVLMVLALYGLHRYWLVYDYFMYSKNVPATPPPVANWPRVTIQLPIFNERYVIERLVEAVSRFDYPPELLDVQVLDDSTAETCEVARDCVERHAPQAMPLVYIHRPNRQGYKQAAPENGFVTTQTEFNPIYRTHFLPLHNFLPS